jgi:hypothetical protein
MRRVYACAYLFLLPTAQTFIVPHGRAVLPLQAATTTSGESKPMLAKAKHQQPGLLWAMSNSGESRAEPIVIAAPQWRGHLHRNGAILFPPFAAWLCFQANSARGLLCAIVFGLAVEGIMSASAVLHTTQWRRTTRLNVARLIDYSMIFVGIASIASGSRILAVRMRC